MLSQYLQSIMIEKFPNKKHLNLEWHQAAIGQFLFFKNLKEKYHDNIYFHLSEAGITLKANNSDLLIRAEEQLNKIFKNSKIQMLDVSYSSAFYQRIIEDIKAYTTKLKDSKDCPYINLVYSEKIRQTCLMMKKFRYNYPYEMWEEQERSNKGFAFLIVRPDYRWKEIEIAVYNMINKRESSVVRSAPEPKIWFIELPFEKFIWIYLKKEFKQYKDMIDIKERKNQNTICIGVNNQLPILNELEKQIETLSYYILETPPSNIKDLIEGTPIVVLFQLELERIMENLYHQFGISNQIRRIKHFNTNSCLVVGPVEVEYWLNKKEQQFDREARPEFPKLRINEIKLIERLNDRNEVIEYQGNRYFAKRYQKPLEENTLNQLKLNHPVLPRFYYYYEKQNCFYLVRHYYYKLFYPTYSDCTTLEKIQWLESLGQIIIDLHKNYIVVGKPFKDNMYMEGDSLVIDCKDKGQIQDDVLEYKQMVRQVIVHFKGLDRIEDLLIEQIKEELEKPSGIIKLVEAVEGLKRLFV